MPTNAFIPLVRKNLITYANAGVGSTLFQHIYVYDPAAQQEKDVLANGELSCASFVSTVLSMVSLIDRPHATVPTTLKAMDDAGWIQIDVPREGAVAHWPANDRGHEHIGFCLNDHEIISNSGNTQTPQKHGLGHPVSGIHPDFYLWHPQLDVDI